MCLVGDLLEYEKQQGRNLEFDDWPTASQCRARRETRECLLRKRHVKDSLRTESAYQAGRDVGDTEPHVLAENADRLITRQFVAQRLVQGLQTGDFRHLSARLPVPASRSRRDNPGRFPPRAWRSGGQTGSPTQADPRSPRLSA